MNMFDGIISEIGSRFGIGDKAKQLIGWLLTYITSGAGGLAGFLERLKNAGLGSIVGGSTSPMTPEQTRGLLGDNLTRASTALGLSESTVTSVVATALPQVVHKLAPGGTAPATLPPDVNDMIQSAQTVAASAATAAGTAGKDAWEWLVWALPLIGLALVLLYLVRGCNLETGGPRGPVPDVSKLTSDLQALFTSTTETLEGIKDEATAKAALPKLKDLEPKINQIQSLTEKLPAEAKATIQKLIAEWLPKLGALAGKLHDLGGPAWETIKPVVTAIIDKFTKMSA